MERVQEKDQIRDHNQEAGTAKPAVWDVEIDESLRKRVIEGVSTWDIRSHNGLSFEDAYNNALDENDPHEGFIRKYKVAQILIEDGKYAKYKKLVEEFIPSRFKLDPEVLEEAKQLKGELNLLLVKRGDVSKVSSEAKNAEDHLAEKFRHSKAMEDLAWAGVPIEVLGQIVTLEECSEMSDAKKLEEFRSWAIHTILRPYLGKLAGKRPETELSVTDLMDRIPKKVFAHPYTVRYNLVEHYFADRLMQFVTDSGLEEGMKTLERIVEETTDQEKKEFMRSIHDKFYDVATFPLNGDFNNTILVKGKQKNFPSFEQRTFCHDFINCGTKLLAADTGLGKTAAAYLAVENSKAEKVLVITPAEVREVWKEQDEVVFKEPGNVYIVRGSSELHKAALSGKKYIVISRELLGRAEKDSNLARNLENFVKTSGVDGAIIDEIHNFSNPNAASTKTAKKLLDLVRSNYNAKNNNSDAPVLGLTATPVKTKDLDDLDVPMALLYPNKYALTPAEATATRKTFSDSYLRSPHLSYIALSGEKRMFRWEQATGMQEFEYETLPIKASAFEQYLCDFIYSEVGGDALNKIRLIENALFNPLLVKAEVRALLNGKFEGKIPELDIDEALGTLKRTVKEWKRLRGTDFPKNPEDYLSADRLVELGLGKIVLSCFFSDLLENGIDTLVEELTKDSIDPPLMDLRLFWQRREISTKYQVLRQKIEESLSWKLDNGSLNREKVIIISPARMQGRTGDVLQRDITDEGGNVSKLYSDPELAQINDAKLVSLVKQWCTDAAFCRGEDILLLDGSVAVGKKRNGVIARYINDPRAAVLVVTLEAAYQGRDFTINNLVDKEGRRISRVHNIFLGPTWYYLQLKQMVGRSLRQEHLVPVKNTIFEIDDSVEQGKGETVRFTRLLTRVVLSGATLHPDDQEFFDSKRVGPRVLHYRNPEGNFLRDVFGAVKGRDPEEIQTFLNRKERGQEKTNAARMAEKFYDGGRDAYKTTGYNAEMVASLVKEFGLYDGKLLSLGAGTLLLQRKLQRGIDNVDFNPYMMEEGWKEAHVYGGKRILANIVKLSASEIPDQSYDFIDSAFALDWAKLGNPQKIEPKDSTRVQVLEKVNKALKIDGTFALTLSPKLLDENKFHQFVSVLESNFGFKVDFKHSGKSFGISRFGTTKRLGWCIVARKIDESNLTGLKLQDLELNGDSREWESNYDKKQNGNGTAPTREEPSSDLKVNFDYYRIINLGGEVEKIDTNGVLNINGNGYGSEAEIETKENNGQGNTIVEVVEAAPMLDLGFLKGETKEDFEIYRRDLLRPLMKITGFSWTEAEDFGINVLQDIVKKSRLSRNKIVAYQQIIKEARRNSNMRGGGN